MDDSLPHVETHAPARMEGNKLYRYSKVLDNHLGDQQARALPQCPHLVWTQAVPLNISAPTNFYQSQKLLSLTEETSPPIVVGNFQNKGKFLEFSVAYKIFSSFLTY